MSKTSVRLGISFHCGGAKQPRHLVQYIGNVLSSPGRKFKPQKFDTGVKATTGLDLDSTRYRYLPGLHMYRHKTENRDIET